MRATDHDRITPTPAARSPLVSLAAVLLALGAVGAGLWYYWQRAEGEQRQQLDAFQNAVKSALPGKEVQTSLIPEPQPAPAPAPPPADALAQQAAATEPPLVPPPEAEPLPVLDASDGAVLAEWQALAGPEAANLLLPEQLLRRFVTFVNNLAAGKLDHKTGPFRPLAGRYTVTTTAPLQASPATAERYTTPVTLLTTVDPARAAALYRRFYPLLANAYAELGEKGNFHARVLQAINVLLATPALPETAALVAAEKGLYRYADPQLEALPAAQKQVLRMGRENGERLKGWLRQCREALLAQPADGST